jgi:hypothetical protein
MKLIRQIVLTVTWTELESSNACPYLKTPKAKEILEFLRHSEF